MVMEQSLCSGIMSLTQIMIRLVKRRVRKVTMFYQLKHLLRKAVSQLR